MAWFQGKATFFIQQKNFERARNRLRLSSLSALNQVRCSLPHRSSCFWCQSLWFSLRSKLNNRAYARMEKMRPWRTRHPKASSRIRANGKDGLVGCAKSSYPKSVLPAFAGALVSEILHCRLSQMLRFLKFYIADVWEWSTCGSRKSKDLTQNTQNQEISIAHKQCWFLDFL